MVMTADSTYPPFWVDGIGRVFSNQTEHFTCDITRVNGASSTLFLPAMYTIEAFFRMDPLYKRPDGYISTVVGIFDVAADAYRAGFGISNHFMRIWLDDHIHDYHYNFTDTDDYWHYVAISYIRRFERETYMYVFIDNVLALETDIFDWYDYDALD